MTTPGRASGPEEMSPALRAVEAGLDSIAREARSVPDPGFEGRLVAAATSAIAGRPSLRVVHTERGRQVRAMPVVRWSVGIAAVLIVASAVLAIRWQPSGPATGSGGDVSLASATTELDEIAAVWELLDDEAIASRVTSLQGRASTISESVHGEWMPSSWLNEDSM